MRDILKWFDPLIAALLAFPLGGALYINYSSMTVGQKIAWALMGMLMGVASSPTTIMQGGAALPETLQAFALTLGGILLFRIVQRLRKKAE